MGRSRKAQVFYKNDLAGYISETKGGYVFEYSKEFLEKNTSISISLPLRKEPYESMELFSFFRGSYIFCVGLPHFNLIGGEVDDLAIFPDSQWMPCKFVLGDNFCYRLF